MYTVRKSVIDSLVICHGWDYSQAQDAISKLTGPVVAVLDKPSVDFTSRLIRFVVGCILFDNQ